MGESLRNFIKGNLDLRVANGPVWATGGISAVADELHSVVDRGLAGAAIVHARVVLEPLAGINGNGDGADVAGGGR